MHRARTALEGDASASTMEERVCATHVPDRRSGAGTDRSGAGTDRMVRARKLRLGRSPSLGGPGGVGALTVLHHALASICTTKISMELIGGGAPPQGERSPFFVALRSCVQNFSNIAAHLAESSQIFELRRMLVLVPDCVRIEVQNQCPISSKPFATNILCKTDDSFTLINQFCDVLSIYLPNKTYFVAICDGLSKEGDALSFFF